MAEATTPALEALVVALHEIGAVKVYIPPAVPCGRPAVAWARLLAGDFPPWSAWCLPARPLTEENTGAWAGGASIGIRMGEQNTERRMGRRCACAP